MDNTKTFEGIRYDLPKVTLLQDSGIGVAEYAARTCYDSFENSENQSVKIAHHYIESQGGLAGCTKDGLNDIEESDLLSNLAWVHHHHSILEHATLSYLVKGTSRGVLQEHARHRIQAISVRSTRYTMSDVLYAYIASDFIEGIIPRTMWFAKKLEELDVLVTKDMYYIEATNIINRLDFQRAQIGTVTFVMTALSRENQSAVRFVENATRSGEVVADELYKMLQQGKKKRNAGDPFKHIVSDNWKVDMVVTFNIRSLKNYFDLRDAGSAWFQIQWLAKAMKEVTPQKYLDLIVKKR